MKYVGSGASRRCTHAGRLVGAGGVDEQGQLVEAGLGVVVVVGGQGDADQHDLLP